MSAILGKTKKELLIMILTLGLPLYIIYSTLFTPPVVIIAHRALFLAVMFVIYFVAIKPLGNSIAAKIIDGVIVIFALLSNGYIFFYYEKILRAGGGYYMDNIEIFLGFTLILIALEATRRASLPFFIVCLTSIMYTLLGSHLPGILQHPGIPFYRIVYLVAFTSEGIFGVGISIAASLLFMFILLGATMEATGTGDFFIRFANSIVGGTRGGSGKASVIGSSLIGSVMGNSTANVIVTGTFTIPLMIKSGFSKKVAAAIECLASEGGQYIPPIMGASAFIMAQITRIPYGQIVVAAVIPALMYYLYVFVLVDAEAAKNGLKGIPRELREPLKQLLKKEGYLLLPLIITFYTIVIMRMTPVYAAMLGVIVTILISQLAPPFKGFRAIVDTTLESLDKGTRGVANLIGLMAGIGLVQQAFLVTGLGGRIASILIGFAGGQVFLLLLIAWLAATILGMGMPTPVAYLLCALFVAPALVNVGIPVMAAHLFLLYVAVKSGSTPPVGVVAMVASGIAKSNFWATAVTSFIFSIPAFVLAFAFVYHPELLLLEGGVTDIAFRVVLTMLSLFGFTWAIQGYMFRKLGIFERLLLTVGAIFLLTSEALFLVAGFLILVGIAAWKVLLSRMKSSKEQKEEKLEPSA